MGTLWFRRDYAFKHRLSYRDLACDSGDWAGYDQSFERFSECVFGVKNVWCRVCFMARLETDQAGRYDGQGEAKPATFWDGVILLLLNPKAYIIMALMFSQFLSTDGGLQIANVLTISTIFTFNNLVAFSIWAAVGDKIADKFRTDEGARRLNLMFGTILAAVAVWMFFS